jgi:hypothetical protein
MSAARWLPVVLALAALAGGALYRLDRPLIWADEAQTGIGARNVLRSGIPTAFDGRNAAVIDSGRTLDQSLRFKQIPWLSFYVGAASIALFGDEAAGLRTLFALLGLLAFVPLHALLRRRVRMPALMTALVLLAPQTLLFLRSARYYALLILLFAALCWLVATDPPRRGPRRLLAAALFVLLFHTHVAVALGCGLSVLLFGALRRRARLWEYLVAVGLGAASWLVWYRSLGPPLGPVTSQLALLVKDPVHWVWLTGGALLATVLDFDLVGAMPLLLAAGLLAWLAWRKREALRTAAHDPLVGFLLISLVVQTLVSAAVFGTETGFGYSLLRYHAHLVVAAMLLVAIAIDAAVGSRAGQVVLCAAWLGCNLGSLSFWLEREGRSVPLSWVPPVIAEIVRPPVEAWGEARETLRTAQGAGRDEVVMALPPWTQEVVLYDVGDRFLVPPLFSPEAPGVEGLFRRAVGEAAYTRLAAPPTWIVDSLGMLPDPPNGYDLVALVPSHRARPDDGTRPELTRHGFPEADGVASVTLYRRRD